LQRERKHGFSPEETIQMVVDYTVNHLTVYELAAKHGCHRTTISRHLNQNGVNVTRCKMDTRQIKEAVMLYESGLSLKAVGKLLGITKTTIRQALIRAGITLRPARRILSKGQG
jgi:transposase-like protein